MEAELSTPDYIKLNGADSVSVTLLHPVKLNGVSTTEITLRAPKVRDMRGAQRQGESDSEVEALLFATLAGAGPADFDDMRWTDYQRVQVGYFRLLDAGGKSTAGADRLTAQPGAAAPAAAAE